MPPQANCVSGPGATPLVGPEAVKALKGQLDALNDARARLVGNALCGHVIAGLHRQIAGVRAQLASAQPLEVALRGTLGGVTQARQALQRAEQKASKHEAIVVAAVASYEAAAAEVLDCKKQLADAEAATARIAGGRIDPRLLLGGQPIAALEVLSEAVSRFTGGNLGLDARTAARAKAAYDEFLAVCRIMSEAVPPAEGSGHLQAGAAT